MYSLLVVLAAVLLADVVWRFLPKTYDNETAETFYTMQGQTYQLCIAWGDMPTEPLSDRYSSAALEFGGIPPCFTSTTRAPGPTLPANFCPRWKASPPSL